MSPSRSGGPYALTNHPSVAPDLVLNGTRNRLTAHQKERHLGVKISPVTPVTPTPHIKPTREIAGQRPYFTGSRIATHSTWCVIGNRSNARSVRTR